MADKTLNDLMYVCERVLPMPTTFGEIYPNMLSNIMDIRIVALIEHHKAHNGVSDEGLADVAAAWNAFRADHVDGAYTFPGIGTYNLENPQALDDMFI